MDNTQSANTSAFFREAKPAVIRLWHWLIFLFFLASITTVIFGSTLFKTDDNIAMVQEQVQEKGGTVTKDQAWKVAHEFSDKLWMLHKFIGFGLSFLLLSRIIVEITLSKEKQLRTRITNALKYPFDTRERKHYLIVQYAYVIFYILFVIMALTGLVLAFEDVAWLKPIHDLAGNIHGVVQWGLYVYILSHIAGAITADLTKYNGIVSRMINGK